MESDRESGGPAKSRSRYRLCSRIAVCVGVSLLRMSSLPTSHNSFIMGKVFIDQYFFGL